MTNVTQLVDTFLVLPWSCGIRARLFIKPSAFLKKHELEIERNVFKINFNFNMFLLFSRKNELRDLHLLAP